VGIDLMIAIYDRTQEDIINKTEKAYMNLADLNRLETNVETLCTELSITFAKHTWIAGKKPKATDYQRIKAALDSIASSYPVLLLVPSRPFNTYQKWNDLEYMLYQTDKILNENINNQPYCGEFYCGEYGYLG
jgi:hypothetical protein